MKTMRNVNHFNLLRTVGRFIDKRRKGQERIISIIIAKKGDNSNLTFNKQERGYWYFLVPTCICSQKGTVLKMLMIISTV